MVRDGGRQAYMDKDTTERRTGIGRAEKQAYRDGDRRQRGEHGYGE